MKCECGGEEFEEYTDLEDVAYFERYHKARKYYVCKKCGNIKDK